MKSYSKNLRPLKGLYKFITRNNAVVIALELAIFAGVIFVLAAEPEPASNEQTIIISEPQNNAPAEPPAEGGTNNNPITAISEPPAAVPDLTQNEIVSKRTENGKTFDLGGNRRSLDVSIGAIHYKNNYADPSEQWKDIDLTWEGNKITKAPYELTLEGKKIIVRDKKTGDVSTIELLDIKPAGLQYEIVPENTRVSFRHTLPNDKVPFESKFRVTGNIPLKTRAFDDEGELSLETTLVDGILTEKLNGAKDKETGKARPVKGSIKVDPTLDLQVGASADDMYETESSGTTADHALYMFFRAHTTAAGRIWGGLRWINSSLSQGNTIDVAYISVYLYGGNLDDPNVNLHFELAAAPATFTVGTSNYNITGRARTIASTSWIASNLGSEIWVNSPSLVIPLQEVVDSYSPTAIALIGRPNSDLAKDIFFRPYNYNSTLAAKLHIEYTAAGGGAEYQPRPGGTNPSGGSFLMF